SLSKEELIELTGKKVDIANKAGYKVPLDYLTEVLEIPLEEKEIDEILKNQEKAEKWDKYSKQFETALQLYSNAKTIDEFFLKNKLPQFIININDEAKILLKQTHDREIVERLKKLIEMNIHSHFPSENTIPIRELQKIMEDKSVKKIG
ncbi:hypothetical protein LCGC14_2264650, partial [marine sediment metagenome]